MRLVRGLSAASASLVATLLIGAATSPAAPGAEPAAEKPAAEKKIEIQKVSGKREFLDAIAKHKGKIVLVDYWATWCGPCVEKLPHNAELVKKFGEKGLVVVALSLDEADDEEAVRKRVTDTPLPGVVLMMDSGDDDSFAKLEDYEVGPLPHFQLFDRSTTLVKEFKSGDPDAVFTSDDIDAAIQAQLDKEKP